MIICKFRIVCREEIPPEVLTRLTRYHSAGRGRLGTGRYYLTGVEPNALTVCQLLEPGADPETALRDYLRRQGVPGGRICPKQISVAELAVELHSSSREKLCPDVPEVFLPLSMMPFVCEPFSNWLLEATFKPKTRAGVDRECARLHSASLKAEVERIRDGAGLPFRGHPVLYSIVTDTNKKNGDMAELLLPLLHQAGRLPAGRACILNPCRHPMPEFVLNDIYRAQSGAAVIVDLQSGEENPEIRESVGVLLRLAREHREKVLTVFRTTSTDTDSQRILQEFGETFPLLKLTEDLLTPSEARRMLLARAKAAGIALHRTAELLPRDRDSFTEQEAEQLFEAWQNRCLCTGIYPQYASVLPTGKTEAPEPPRTSAMEELQQLIGLTEAKRIIGQVADYIRVQQLCREHGLPTEPPRLHMVFAGNPGTAKTTVARLIARIFRECGVLSVGELVEVGRGDLIGKYVGWTAKLVQEKFRQAEGSVLFIDEAYSLLDDRENQFGDEAINAIVQEMENHRDSTVVIFAGYREPMQRFLERNPGLRSRVSYTVDFPDYSEDELLEIFRRELSVRSRELDPHAEEKVRELIRSGMGQVNFGNGRYVRGMVERAMLAQASRLAALPKKKVTAEALRRLTAEDFEPAKTEKKAQTRPIGFCA